VFVNVNEVDGQPVAVFTSEKWTSEQESGVIVRLNDCCPLTSEPPMTVTEPPEAEATTDAVGFVPVEKRLVPSTVTAVEWPPGPELGEGPLVMFGTLTTKDAADVAVSPVARSVTPMTPLLLGHPAGGLARIWVPLTEMTVPCDPPNVTMRGATKPCPVIVTVVFASP
jgi:hypothetical protein